MPRLHLTDLVVQRLGAVGIYYDTKNPAFGIRVGKYRKAWVIVAQHERVVALAKFMDIIAVEENSGRAYRPFLRGPYRRDRQARQDPRDLTHQAPQENHLPLVWKTLRTSSTTASCTRQASCSNRELLINGVLIDVGSTLSLITI